MLIFSLLSNVDACATRRRMSFPEAGFAMMPTAADPDLILLSSADSELVFSPERDRVQAPERQNMRI